LNSGLVKSCVAKKGNLEILAKAVEYKHTRSQPRLFMIARVKREKKGFLTFHTGLEPVTSGPV